MRIAVVVPTIRPDCYRNFLDAWDALFRKHRVEVVAVFDGEEPHLCHDGRSASVGEIMGTEADLIFNRTSACGNLGFVYAVRELQADIVIKLDDDVRPLNDTIQDHLDALASHVPLSWMNTALNGDYMRGFPYALRSQAEVVLSHGIWHEIADWDGPTQLVKGPRVGERLAFYEGVIPRGCYYPMCGMNVAFKSKAAPFMYLAPTGHRTANIHRFDDIWCGVVGKRHIDARGWAVLTGRAAVIHGRASNVFKNIQLEAKGLEYNEVFHQGFAPAIDYARQQGDDEMVRYLKKYEELEARWRALMEQYVSEAACTESGLSMIA